MLALGNDIVDLLERPKNGNRYFQRLLKYSITNAEIQLLDDNSVIEVGLLSRLVWAIKESAYKSSNKLGNRDRFHPKMFVIASLRIEGKKVHGKVDWDQYELTIEGLIHVTHLHIWTTHANKEVKVSDTKCKKGTIRQSLRVRDLALNSFGIEGATVEKDLDGIPWILDPKGGKIELSLSHHGSFVACAHQT